MDKKDLCLYRHHNSFSQQRFKTRNFEVNTSTGTHRIWWT